MPKAGFKSVDDYLAAQPEAAQSILSQVRNAIRDALPAAEEVISYNIPTYKLNGRAVLYFAGWKQHFSLYPIGERAATIFKHALTPYEIVKSTVRFPLSQPVPVKLIGRIAKFRAKELAEREKPKAPKKR